MKWLAGKITTNPNSVAVKTTTLKRSMKNWLSSPY